MLTAQAMCARSAATSARDVVPFGVLTIVVSQPVGRASGHALLEERRPVGAVREALHQGRSAAHRAHQRLGDAQVVVDEVELGLAALREEDLVGAGDAHLVPVDLEDRLLVSWTQPPRS